MSTRTETNQPFKTELKPHYALSLLIAVLMAGASITGILYRPIIYPSETLLQTFLPNDLVNLLVGVPILLGSMWITKRGKLIGLLLWPGALFYVLYNYLAYVFGLPFNLMFLPNLALTTLSAYTLIGLMAGIDGDKVKVRLAGSVPEKVGGGILLGFGLIYLIRVCTIAIGANLGHTSISDSELAPMISDFIVCPAWIIGGILLWRRKAFGYVTGLGLLFQASMLFIALIIYLLVQPGLTGSAFSPVDVIVVFIMGMVCFIPFGLFARGALRNSDFTVN